jgi:hypothetical protein
MVAMHNRPYVPSQGISMDRDVLIVQMAKAFSGQQMMDPSPPSDELRRRAAEALTRVEIYLGADVEQAKEILVRVLEDVS